jgi:signal transduction histidine kinase
VLGQALGMLMPERYRGGHTDHLRRFATTGITSRRMGDGTVIHGLRANGEEFPMDASISQLQTAEGKLFTVILRDVTERVRAQEERSEFAAAAQAIREEEKARVARELHDELAQSLTALKMDTIWVRDSGTQSPQALARLADMLGMLDHAVASTRRIAADLRPLLLDNQRSGAQARLQVDEDMELQEPHATAVFRIVQEALANVAKHAGATEVTVSVERSATGIDMLVKDNGRGFDPGAPRKIQSLGIMGLRERAQLLHGGVTIDSAPGRGTSVRVRIPLQTGALP